MKRTLITIAAAVVIVLLVVMGMGALKKGKKEAPKVQAREIAVSLAKPVVGPVSIVQSFTGKVKTLREVKVASKIPGRAVEVSVEEGQPVSRGQVLVKLDQREVLAQIAQTQASLLMAQVRVTQARLSAKVKSTQSSTALAQAQVSLDTARSSASQARDVLELQKVQTDTAIAQSQANLEATRARLAQAGHALDLQKVQVDTGIAQAHANLEGARARLSQAQTAYTLTQSQTDSSIATAEAALKASRERLAVLEKGNRPQERMQADHDVAQAQANCEFAEKELERMKLMLKNEAVSRQQYDNAEKNFQVSKSLLAAARERRSLVYEGPREEDISIAREQVRQAEESLAMAKMGKSRVEMSQRDIDALKEQVRTAEESLIMAKAAKLKVEIGVKDIDALQEQVRTAEEALIMAKAGSIQNDIRAKQASTARKSVVSAREGVRFAQTDKYQNAINAQEVNAALAAVRQIEGSLQYLQVQLDNTVIRAPLDGVVQARIVNPGEGVDMNKGIIVLIDTQNLYVDVDVPDTRLENLQPARKLVVALDALPGRTFEGRLLKVLPQADPQKKAFIARIGLVNPEGGIRPGMFARVELVVATKARATLVPRDAIVDDNRTKNVYVVGEDGKARLQPVTLGIQKDELVEVTGGVTAATEIVVRGQQYLKPGDTVSVQKSQET